MDRATAFFERSAIAVPTDLPLIAWAKEGDPEKPYCPIVTSDRANVPNIAVCIPTGGGKTIIGLSVLAHVCVKSDPAAPRFAVWLVPTDAIFRQVMRGFSIGGEYFNFVKDQYGLEINLKKSTDKWTDDDLSSSKITILLLTFQSLIRRQDAVQKKALQIYRNADSVTGLSVLKNTGREPSLYGLLQVVRPIFIIDEAHRYYTEVGRDFFKSKNISKGIFEMTATPREYSRTDFPNIIFTANGRTLIRECLIKRPIVYHSLISTSPDKVVADIVTRQKQLEETFRCALLPVIPKALISVEFTSRAHASKTYSADSIKKLLQNLGVKDEQIVIKSSERDELGDRDLDDSNDPARFIITKRALVEGWDCKSVFTIALLNNIGADTTNFQLVGRGLRQPGRKYYEIADANELHIYTNSRSHDASVHRLTTFLSDSGFGDASNLVVNSTADSKVRFEHALPKGKSISLIVDRKRSVAIQSEAEIDYFRGSKSLEEFTVSESEIVETEEWIQKIDVSNSVSDGLAQTSSSRTLDADFDGTRLRGFLFRGLRDLLFDSAFAFKVAEACVRKLNDRSLGYRNRAALLLAVRQRVTDRVEAHQGVYFREVVSGRTEEAAIPLTHVFGERVQLTAVPDPIKAPFRHSLLGDIPKSLFNDEELRFARFLDSLTSIRWFRNPPGVGVAVPYALGNFYPDFIVVSAAQTVSGANTLYIETKGAHLVGSRESVLKKEACDVLTTKFSPRVELVFAEFDLARVRVEEWAKGVKPLAGRLKR